MGAILRRVRRSSKSYGRSVCKAVPRDACAHRRPSAGGSAAVVDVEEPEPGPGELLVDGIALGVCGTDREMVAGKLDPSMECVGVLMEPASVLAKAWEHVDRIGNRAYSFATAATNASGNPELGEIAGAAAPLAANAFVVFFRMSWGPVVWVLLGEMFPNRIRAIEEM
jgi:hypothetical protein